jgi:hypothetical protein
MDLLRQAAIRMIKFLYCICRVRPRTNLGRKKIQNMDAEKVKNKYFSIV